jgi:RNA polymerase sigma factor (sigma-70 family)
LKRALENAHSQAAVAYYFSDDLPAGMEPPDWPLDQLYAWLHGVLRFVVREEQHRASSRREISMGTIGSDRADGNRSLDPADREPDQLDALLRKELQGIVAGCFRMLDREYRTVLKMRVEGLKYGEIAGRLGISENTVATWVSRGIGALAQHVRRRMERVINLPRNRDQAAKE